MSKNFPVSFATWAPPVATRPGPAGGMTAGPVVGRGARVDANHRGPRGPVAEPTTEGTKTDTKGGRAPRQAGGLLRSSVSFVSSFVPFVPLW
jgi:hypothetical protein